MELAGGCLCGGLRYVIDGDAVAVGKCYCADCRKETGTGHLNFLSVPADAIKLSGESRRYVRAGGSGEDVARIFCPTCGSTVVGYPDYFGPIAAVRAGTLDDPSKLSPTLAFYVRSAQSWDQPPGELKIFDTLPTRKR